jgi:hypothetical protein
VTTSFTRTRTQIAQRVLGKVIKLGAASMASADSDTVYEAIDLRLKSMHTRGIFWRKVTSVPVTFSLSSSIATASAGAGDILFPMKVTFSNGATDDPVYIINSREYAAIEDKTRTGNPEKVLWKGGSEFIFYPVPGANGTAKLLYEKIADDTSAGAAVDIDVAMIRPMMDLVKYDVADDYGIPEATQVRWRADSVAADIEIRKLGTPRTDYLPVAVDDFDGRQPNSRRTSDYNW